MSLQKGHPEEISTLLDKHLLLKFNDVGRYGPFCPMHGQVCMLYMAVVPFIIRTLASTQRETTSEPSDRYTHTRLSSQSPSAQDIRTREGRAGVIAADESNKEDRN